MILVSVFMNLVSLFMIGSVYDFGELVDEKILVSRFIILMSVLISALSVHDFSGGYVCFG